MVTVSWPSPAANDDRGIADGRRGRERLQRGGPDALDERGAGGRVDAGVVDGVRGHHGARRSAPSGSFGTVSLKVNA